MEYQWNLILIIYWIALTSVRQTLHFKIITEIDKYKNVDNLYFTHFSFSFSCSCFLFRSFFASFSWCLFYLLFLPTFFLHCFSSRPFIWCRPFVCLDASSILLSDHPCCSNLNLNLYTIWNSHSQRFGKKNRFIFQRIFIFSIRCNHNLI